MYDRVNSFNLQKDKYLFFDIFHKNNELILICPVYTTDMEKLKELLNSINIEHENTKLQLINVISKIGYEPTLILIYEFISNSTTNSITVEYENTINEYTLYHKIPTTQLFIGMTTLFKNDYNTINIFYDYYEKQGYDYYFMYYNGELTDEIKELYNKPKITLIEWNFPYWNDDGWDMKIHHHAQLGQMHHAIYKYGKNETMYMGFHDLDEYLYIPNQSIKDYVKNIDCDLIGFLNRWSKTVDELGNCIIPEKIPNTLLVDKDIWRFGRRSKAIYKIENVITINIHNPHQFNDNNKIKFNLENTMFHIYNWTGRVMDECECSPVKINYAFYD